MKKISLLITLAVLLSVFLILNSSQGKGSPNTKPIISQNIPKTLTIAENLEIPWGLAFLPNGNILVTERPGRVKLIDKSGNIKLISQLQNVLHIGEGGLLGIALHPNFSSNGYVYFYYTYSNSQDTTFNRVVRMVYKDEKLSNEEIIVDKIPGAPNHNGGRIKFGPDNFLYIATGDAQNPSQAQDTNSLAGKILRVTDEGKAEVYSYGHRNVQGLAWDANGNLWTTEHGRSGALSGLDELNLIQKGKNYGWPVIQGDEKKQGMETPVINSGPDITWAPSGVAFLNNSLYFGGLRVKHFMRQFLTAIKFRKLKSTSKTNTEE